MGLFSGIYNSLVYAPELKKRYNELTESSYIPPSLEAAVSNGKLMANQTLYAGQDNDQNNVDRAAANQISNIQRTTRSGANAINAASGVYNNQLNQYANIRAKGAQIRQNNTTNYNSLLMQKAGQERTNKNQYLAAKSALLGAMDNAKMGVFQGIDDTLTEGAKLASNIYGGGKSMPVNWD